MDPFASSLRKSAPTETPKQSSALRPPNQGFLGSTPRSSTINRASVSSTSSTSSLTRSPAMTPRVNSGSLLAESLSQLDPSSTPRSRGAAPTLLRSGTRSTTGSVHSRTSSSLSSSSSSRHKPGIDEEEERRPTHALDLLLAQAEAEKQKQQGLFPRDGNNASLQTSSPQKRTHVASSPTANTTPSQNTTPRASPSRPNTSRTRQAFTFDQTLPERSSRTPSPSPVNTSNASSDTTTKLPRGLQLMPSVTSEPPSPATSLSSRRPPPELNLSASLHSFTRSGSSGVIPCPAHTPERYFGRVYFSHSAPSIHSLFLAVATPVTVGASGATTTGGLLPPTPRQVSLGSPNTPDTSFHHGAHLPELVASFDALLLVLAFIGTKTDRHEVSELLALVDDSRPSLLRYQVFAQVVDLAVSTARTTFDLTHPPTPLPCHAPKKKVSANDPVLELAIPMQYAPPQDASLVATYCSFDKNATKLKRTYDILSPPSFCPPLFFLNVWGLFSPSTYPPITLPFTSLLLYIRVPPPSFLLSSFPNDCAYP